MQYTVYILKSEKDNKYYIGQSESLEQRILAHNNGSVRATRNRRPLTLVYKETYNSRSEALKRESYIKRYKDTEKFLNYHRGG